VIQRSYGDYAVTLSNKDEAFVSEYFLCNMNGTEAARRLGYNPNVQGPRLLVKVSIANEIKRRLADKHMSADEVLVRLSAQARGDIIDYIDILPGGRQVIINLGKAQEAKKTGLIKKIKVTKQGPEIELYDAQTALHLIGKQSGLFADEHIVTYKVSQELEKALDKLESGLDADTYARILAILADGETGSTETASQSEDTPITLA